jgi:hypothetical protein
LGKISIKGVVIGGVVDVVTSLITGVAVGIVFAGYTMSRLRLSHVAKEQIGPALIAATHGSKPLYLTEILLGLLCSALGGYVAATIAKHDELLNGTLSSFLCVALGIYSMQAGKDYHPLWVQIFLLFAAPACALLGGELRRRKRERMTFAT